MVQRFVPPIAMAGLRRMRRAARPAPQPLPPALFDGDSAMFERVVASARVYGEYGVGASTDWVYANTSAAILANDTSPFWAEKTLVGKDPARIDLQLVDVGETGAWGRPLSYARRDNFVTYCTSIWTRQHKPDVVLVDGRFRVCCFLTSVIEGGAGLRILFDDYANRPYYHVVEEVLPVVERCGRQALFEVTAGLDLAAVAALRDRFCYVMD